MSKATESAAKANAVVTVFGAAGGVGTTTVATALARAISRRGVGTTLLDLNLHAPAVANALGEWAVGLERFLKEPKLEALRVSGTLSYVPGLAELQNLDEISVGGTVSLLGRFSGTVRVVDTAPVVTDPAVYAAVRSRSRLVLVTDTRPGCVERLQRLRRLFSQLGMGWHDALLVVNEARPTKTERLNWADSVGLTPVAELAYVGDHIALVAPLRLGSISEAVLRGSGAAALATP